MAPVTASVLTTSMSFLPMMFMGGILGKFIREIPLAVLCCLGASLFETFFVLPGHIAHWITPEYLQKRKQLALQTTGKKNISARFFRFMDHLWENKVVTFYLKALKPMLRYRYITALGIMLLLVGSVIFASKKMKFILFPPEGIEIFFIRAQTPQGTPLEQTAEAFKSLEKVVASLPKEEVDNYTTSIGLQQQDPHDPNTKRGSEYGQISVFLTPETDRQRKAHDIIEDLRNRLGHPPAFTKLVFDRVNPGPPMGRAVSLSVRSEHYKDILPAVNDIKKRLQQMKGVRDIEDSYHMGKEEVVVSIKASEAAAAKLTATSIGHSVRASYEGIIATTIRSLNEKTDVRVSLPQEERSQVDSLQSILIPNPMGHLIPLQSVADLKKDQHLSVYQHEDYEREIKVTADVDTVITSSQEINNQLRMIMPEIIRLHPKITLSFGGEDEDTQESMQNLFKAFAMAVLGIFLILVFTFRQLLQPLLVLLTIPLGAISVIWAFFFHGMPLSFMGMIGVIALGGVIVNNAIVFVDFVNELHQKKKMDMIDCILETAKRRLKPIFLTTVTTIIGVLPTAYGIGGLDKFVVPIAMSLGWGLTVGSILTIFIFPSSLLIVDDITNLAKKLFPSLYKTYQNH
jgi:multidrug efflux pump subunit AcrB